jgi:diaminopimelate decarboxylase
LPELSVGDTLAIMDAGAYFVPFSTSFSFPRPGVVLVENGAVRPLRRAETFEDLSRLDLTADAGDDGGFGETFR